MGKLTVASSAVSASSAGTSKTHTIASNKDPHACHGHLPSPSAEDIAQPPPWIDIPQVIIEDPVLHEDQPERPESPRCDIAP